MRSRIILFLLLLFSISNCTAIVSAGAVYSNDIIVLDDNILFTIEETYTDVDVQEFRQMLDLDRSGDVNISEVEAFKESHLISKKIELGSYILIDEGDVPLKMMSVVMEFENAQGDINITSPINVTTFVEYKFLSPIPSGEHELWILGHPLIQNMKITLPEGVIVASSDGLDNMTTSTYDGKIILEGESGIRTFMVENRTIFEYATTVDMYKKPFYAESYFLPLLVFIEMLLAVFAIYMIKGKKQSS